MAKAHRVVLFAFDGCQLLDVAGPASAFGVANSISRRVIYEVHVASPNGRPVRTSCGVTLGCIGLAKATAFPADTLLVGGGATEAMRKSIELPNTQRSLRRGLAAAVRFGSVCSGAFILAALGLVENKRVATHWASCDLLAQMHPSLVVDSASLFVVDGRVWTSAGVSAGIDMALAMIESDLGATMANRVARFLVLHARRPGYQSQFSEVLTVQSNANAKFADAISWLQDRLPKKVDVSELATRAGMTERTFHHKFLASTGKAPAQFIRSVRLDLARTLLESGLPLKTVVKRSGVGSVTWLNAAFTKRFGLSPTTFRKLSRAQQPSNLATGLSQGLKHSGL